jgi:hypothetical protein
MIPSTNASRIPTLTKLQLLYITHLYTSFSAMNPDLFVPDLSSFWPEIEHRKRNRLYDSIKGGIHKLYSSITTPRVHHGTIDELIQAVKRDDDGYVRAHITGVIGPPNNIQESDGLDSVLEALVDRYNIAMFEWILLYGYPVDELIFARAARQLKLELCKFLHAHGVVWDKFQEIQSIHQQIRAHSENSKYVARCNRMLDWMIDPDEIGDRLGAMPNRGTMDHLKRIALESPPPVLDVWKPTPARIIKPSKRKIDKMRRQKIISNAQILKDKVFDASITDKYPKIEDKYDTYGLVSRDNQRVNDSD